MAWNWQDLLGQMNDAILTDPHVADFALPPEVIKKGWIGYDPATEEQIARAEARLGLTLPPSYREFLQVSNGWRVCNPWMDEVFPVEKIDFTRNDPDLMGLWEYSGNDAASASLPDLVHTIQISAWTDMAALLLNPQKSTQEGEWEAWCYYDNIPSARVFPSFWDLMRDQLEGQLHAKESFVASPPRPKQDQREVVVSAIQHVRQSWLMTSEYDPIQGEIDAILARIRVLAVDNHEEFQAGLREIVSELKGSSASSGVTAQELLINLINSNISTNNMDYIRRYTNLLVGRVIEMYV